MHQAAVAEGFEMLITNAVIGFVVLAGGEEADIILKIVVDFLEAIGGVDEGKEPARPGEGLNVIGLEELAIEKPNQALQSSIGRDILLGAPTQQYAGLAANLVLHLAFCGI